ncbi:MAG: TorF family putative porin [Methyloceanibacter sp.]|uniref:TorF family putative porin n=1 Tax=Methyloceanibacter sp. TaxID=1965321 RepID=UPI003D9B0730
MGRTESNLIVLALLSGWAASCFATGARAETSSALNGIAFTTVATLTSDYVYRGVSQSAGNPAAQGWTLTLYRCFSLSMRSAGGSLLDGALLAVAPHGTVTL